MCPDYSSCIATDLARGELIIYPVRRGSMRSTLALVRCGPSASLATTAVVDSLVQAYQVPGILL